MSHLIAASGAKIIPLSIQYEEDDSAMGFRDYLYSDGGKLAGYILQSPSGRKHSVSIEGQNGFIGSYRTSFDAERALLAEL